MGTGKEDAPGTAEAATTGADAGGEEESFGVGDGDAAGDDLGGGVAEGFVTPGAGELAFLDFNVYPVLFKFAKYEAPEDEEAPAAEDEAACGLDSDADVPDSFFSSSGTGGANNNQVSRK